MSILMTEYDYATDIAVKQEEAYAQGAHQKALETAKNLFSMGLSPEQVAQGTTLPLETVCELAQEL